MRIIGGTLRGRRLPSPGWSGLRPTSDRLRETLFNILGPAATGARVLDGCAGTGALGLEALSRGAAHVTFIDSDTRAVALIEANLERCGVAGCGTVIRGVLPRALDRVAAAAAFDLVLLDPPYEYDDRAMSAILSAAGRRTASGGQVVLERPRRAEPVAAAQLRHTRRVRAGNSVLDFHVRTEE
jgi:16S rRNA (guanine966-N2)-methyltransferase